MRDCKITYLESIGKVYGVIEDDGFQLTVHEKWFETYEEAQDYAMKQGHNSGSDMLVFDTVVRVETLKDVPHFNLREYCK